jgi:hypothetical protein
MKMISVRGNGQWEAHVKGRNPIWNKLTDRAYTGDITIKVKGNLDWEIGDEIIITSTDHNWEQRKKIYKCYSL